MKQFIPVHVFRRPEMAEALAKVQLKVHQALKRDLTILCTSRFERDTQSRKDYLVRVRNRLIYLIVLIQVDVRKELESHLEKMFLTLLKKY